MHPAFYQWWKTSRRGAECHSRAEASCGPFGARHHGGEPDPTRSAGPPGHDEPFGGGPFGVRRPLRFLAHKLELDEAQVEELARIMNTLKTERAQAEVDQRRTTAAYADLLAGESFDEAAASKVSSERVRSAERLQTAVQTALTKIHALLTAEQRKRLTYLLRTGALRL